MRTSTISGMLSALSLAAALAAPTAAQADTFTFSFDNVPSQGESGSADNASFTFLLGANAFLTGFTWSVDVSAYDPSWLSELTLEFTNSSGEGVEFSPAPDTDAPGNHVTSGSVDLINTGLSFRLKQDGALHLDFYDAYDDMAGPDGRWNTGTLTFQYTPAVPEPSMAVMMLAGLGACGFVAARRRRASVTV